LSFLKVDEELQGRSRLICGDPPYELAGKSEDEVIVVWASEVSTKLERRDLGLRFRILAS
jgi:hypothetical protein